MTTYSPPFMTKPDAGFRLGDIRTIWDAIANENGQSKAYGITAAGTTQATGTQLTSVFNEIDTAAASTGVNLPSATGQRSTPFCYCVIYNNGANAVQVYAAQNTSDTINGVAGATGVSQLAGSLVIYVSAKPGVWASLGAGSNVSVGALSVAGNITETTVGKGFIQKRSTTSAAGDGRAGTFTLVGASTVTVTNTTVAAGDFIGVSLNTPIGTVGALPVVRFVQAGTAFAVLGTAADSSTYNYTLIGTN